MYCAALCKTLRHSACNVNEDTGGHNEDKNTSAPVLTTRPLPYNASALAMTTALSEDLNLIVLSIKEDCCDVQMGRKWTIEFGSGEE